MGDMTFSKTTQIIIGVIIATVGLSMVGYIIYRDFKTETDSPTELVNVGGILLSPEDAKHVTVEEISVMSFVPKLERSISFPASFPEEAQDIIRNKIVTLRQNLKKDSTLVNDWLDLGIQYKTIGDYEGAKEVWEYSSLLSPSNFVSFYNLGDLYHFYLKDYQASEKNYLQVIANKPDYVNSYRALYDLYHLSYKEKSTLAPTILLKGLDVNKGNVDLLILLGGHYKGVGDKSSAKKYYSLALAEAEKIKNISLVQVIQTEIDSL